jgi:hypothetical protein
MKQEQGHAVADLLRWVLGVVISDSRDQKLAGEETAALRKTPASEGGRYKTAVKPHIYSTFDNSTQTSFQSGNFPFPDPR